MAELAFTSPVDKKESSLTRRDGNLSSTVTKLPHRTDVTTPIALVASAEEKTNYLLIKTTVAEEEPVAIQLYGELAEITGIGQGFGTKILVHHQNHGRDSSP